MRLFLHILVHRGYCTIIFPPRQRAFPGSAPAGADSSEISQFHAAVLSILIRGFNLRRLCPERVKELVKGRQIAGEDAFREGTRLSLIVDMHRQIAASEHIQPNRFLLQKADAIPRAMPHPSLSMIVPSRASRIKSSEQPTAGQGAFLTSTSPQPVSCPASPRSLSHSRRFPPSSRAAQSPPPARAHGASPRSPRAHGPSFPG